MRHLLKLVLPLAAVLVAAPAVLAQDAPKRVEVIEVQGIIDGSVERAVLAGIEEAESSDAVLVVLQIDSKGVVDARRTERITRAITDARVPIASWIGPPGAQAANGAALIAATAHVRAMAPGSILGPYEADDLRSPTRNLEATPFDEPITATQAQDEEVVSIVEPALEQVVEKIDDPKIDLDEVQIRFHKLDVLGRLLHAAAQPSTAYLFLLAGLFAITFELFHPSTGPAGVSGLAALGLSAFGIVTLGGSWIGVALIVASMVAFSIDLRYESLGPFTFGAIIALIAGSLLLFPSPSLRVSPWVLALGIVGMTVFMVSVMTRVMRDLRAVARGELEVREAHPHPEGENHDA